jgi:hypothetical protein
MIIGINGPIGSGKNTVANILEKNFGFETMGFADKLKESAAALFDIDPKDWEKIKNEPSARVTLKWEESRVAEWGEVVTSYFEKSITGREFLKRYGTESHRKVFWDNFWVDVLLDRENSHLFAGNVAIYDARFDNELARIKEVGGKNIQIRRLGYDFDPSHPSEAPPSPDLIDHIIYNSGTLKGLEYKINYLVESGKLGVLRLSAPKGILSPSL